MKIFLWLIATMVIGVLPVCSQESNFQDSFIQIIDDSAKSYESRYDALIDLGFSYYRKDVEKLHQYAEKAMELAVAHQDEFRMARANLLLGIGFISTQEFYRATPYFERALEAFEKLEMPNEIYKVYNNLAIIKQRLGNSDEAVFYLLEALKIAERLQSQHMIVSVKNNLALVFRSQGENEASLQQFIEIEKITHLSKIKFKRAKIKGYGKVSLT